MAGPSSLVVVAVFQVLALDVTSTVVSAGQLHAIFVHAPAYAAFPATGGLALFALEEPLPVTVGQRKIWRHNAGGVF